MVGSLSCEESPCLSGVVTGRQCRDNSCSTPTLIGIRGESILMAASVGEVEASIATGLAIRGSGRYHSSTQKSRRYGTMVE